MFISDKSMKKKKKKNISPEIWPRFIVFWAFIVFVT